MPSTEPLILIDSDSRRRARISHMLSGIGVHVEPFETIEEVGERWPRAGMVLVLDEGNAIARAVAAIGQTGNWLPVIAFAETPDPQTVAEAILAGAVGFAGWPFQVDEFAVILERARQHADRVAGSRSREALARRRIERLTRREREVLSAVANGLSNRLIAERLSISPRTVEIHRANMLNKMDVGHSSEAIRIAIEAALVD
jgi:two-component system, LuxR family, response regulator FixJ